LHGKDDKGVERVTLSLTRALKRRLIQEAKAMFGDRKGALSLYVEATLRNHFSMRQQGVEER